MSFPTIHHFVIEMLQNGAWDINLSDALRSVWDGSIDLQVFCPITEHLQKWAASPRLLATEWFGWGVYHSVRPIRPHIWASDCGKSKLYEGSGKQQGWADKGENVKSSLLSHRLLIQGDVMEWIDKMYEYTPLVNSNDHFLFCKCRYICTEVPLSVVIYFVMCTLHLWKRNWYFCINKLGTRAYMLQRILFSIKFEHHHWFE